MLFATALLASAVTATPFFTKVTRDDSPTNGGVVELDTINKWRSARGVPALAWSDKLVGNAAKTGQDDGGVNENHELNDGSFAQVITPGFIDNTNNFDLQGMTPFELAYVGWLCEAPFGPLNEGSPTPCETVNNVEHLSYSGTGHADILNSDSYHTIGCAFTQNPNAEASSPYQGLWICDLGF